MQVSELYGLTQWISAAIRDAGIVGRYEALHGKLQQNAQGNQPQQPFAEEKENLIRALSSVPVNSLTDEQVRFLECIGIGAHVGRVAADAVEDILVRNPLDSATAANTLREIIGSLNVGIERSDRLARDLADCVTPDQALGQDVLVRVKFAGGAAIENVVDLRNWAKTWHGIIRGLAMAHNQRPEDIRIIGAGRGSLLFDLATPYGIAITITGIIYAALKVAEKVVKIQKQVHEVESLKLANKKIARELEAEAKSVEDEGVDQVTLEFVAKLKIDRDSQGDIVEALKKSVADLIGFTRKGGEVDFVLPDQPADEAEEETRKRAELATTLEHIRELESQLRQLAPGEATQ